MNLIRSWPRDRPVPRETLSVIAQGETHLVLLIDVPERRLTMQTLTWLISGGFAKGYRTQILGIATALSTIALWAAGDMTLAELISSLPLALGGLGLAALGAKVDNAKTPKPARAK